MDLSIMCHEKEEADKNHKIHVLTACRVRLIEQEREIKAVEHFL